MAKTVQWYYKKLKKQPENQSVSDEELLIQAEALYSKELLKPSLKISKDPKKDETPIKDFEIESLFVDIDEKRQAKELALKYFREFAIENVSDKNTLRQLIYLEIVNVRLQTMLNKVYNESKATPLNVVDTIHKNIDKMVNLKTTLGLAKGKDQDNNDFISNWELLKKKALQWRNENQASRTMVCPHCGQMTLLKIKTDIYESMKHPFFVDRILGNKYLVGLYLAKKLSKEDIANILEASTDYIEWLIEKWNLIPKEENKDEIETKALVELGNETKKE